jgi:hypothetical protein
MRRFATACLLLAVSTPALADDRPPNFPTRDVTVTYRTDSQRDVTMSFSAATHRMRIVGMGGQAGYAIIERDEGQMMLVIPARQMVMRMPEPPAMRNAMSLQAFSQVARAGTATVAGVACTVWTVHGDRGEGEICVTADGVMLRARGEGTNGHAAMMEATNVDYGALPASEFEPPSDYQTMTMPAGAGGRPGAMPPAGMPPGAKPPP